MFSWLRRLTSGTPRAAAPAVRARYDNSLTTPENQRQWWGADWLSAKSANNYQVRRQLRVRSRYEVSNNPYLFGICNNNADDLVSTGPTLQLTTPDAGYNRAVERAWRGWAAEVELAEKLRTCKLAKSVDGEGFLVLKTVRDLEHPVKLYPCDVEADQVTTPAPNNLVELWVDGLDLHPVTGRPVAYHVLKNHPGDYFFPTMNPLAVERLPARHVVHWFHKFRPGMVRGVPVFTPSLDLFVELRAYRRAVLGAAELAADFAAVLEQDRETGAYVPDEDADAEIEAFKRVPIDRKMMTTLPPGAKMAQFRPEQPQTTYEMFQEKCLGEACRPLSYPLNLALGTSQKFNFSSAKLDHINYRSSLDVERRQCEAAVLAPLFAAWYEEAVLAGAVPMYDGTTLPPHEWHWPGYEPLDPVADAQADHERLSNGTLTWREFWARRGHDWRDVLRQQADEQKEIARLGLEFGEPPTKSITEDGDPPGNKTGPAVDGRGNTVYRGGDEFDESKHPRADDGKFGSGGGSGDKGGADSREEDHGERHSKWESHDAKTEEKRGREAAKAEKAREKEDGETEKARGKEDKDHQKAVEAHEKKREAVEKAREKEDAAVEAKREKEDAAHEKKAEKLEGDRERVRGQREESESDAADDRAEEDEKTQARREKEDEKTDKAREKEDAEAQEFRDEEDDGGEPDAETQKAREKEDAEALADREKEDSERQAARDAEDAGLQAKRDEEDKDAEEFWGKQEAELDEREAALEKGREEREAAREAEDEGRQQERDEEDDELDAALADLEREAEAREKLRDREDAETQARRDREDEERQAKDDAEDAETYRARAKEHAGAHEAYYDGRHHERYGGRKPSPEKAEAAGGRMARA